jgi:hypothetical protein
MTPINPKSQRPSRAANAGDPRQRQRLQQCDNTARNEIKDCFHF